MALLGWSLGNDVEFFSLAQLAEALAETATLDGSLRKVVQGNRGFDANFMGLTRDTAELACKRLQARQVNCFMIGPS